MQNGLISLKKKIRIVNSKIFVYKAVIFFYLIMVKRRDKMLLENQY